MVITFVCTRILGLLLFTLLGLLNNLRWLNDSIRPCFQVIYVMYNELERDILCCYLITIIFGVCIKPLYLMHLS